MSMLDFARVYIFSEVNGVVLMNGTPISGAKVTRTADYQDKLYKDTVTTDDNGRFHFDDIYKYSMRLSETVVWQKIVINHEGKDYLAWETIKRHDDRYGELNKLDTPASELQKLNFTCELTKPDDTEQIVGLDLERRTITGLCQW